MGAAPLRLLYVSHSFPPRGQPMANIGGMQRVATELHEALQARRDIHLSSLVLRTSWKWTHLRTAPFLAGLLYQIPRRIRQQEIDVVLFSSMVTASLAPLVKKLLHRPTVKLAAIAHGRDVTLPVTPYQQFLPSVFETLDIVLPVSRATSAACTERGLPSANCRVVPNGVNPSRFDRPKMTHKSGALDDGKQRVRLCSVGRQVERKGFVWFVKEVMPRLPAHVDYYLAGSGPQHEAIQEAADNYGVSERVHLFGKIPEADLVQLYRNSDLFIMPNVPIAGDMEGFGVVMLEAGICGLPTIAARLEGIQDVITEKQNGHLVTPGDADAFADWIRYYASNPGALADASLRVARYTEEQFAWSAVADRYVRVLSDV